MAELSKEELRGQVRDNLKAIVTKLNSALTGKQSFGLREVLSRVGRGGQLPHWYEQLKQDGTLPNLDGKTIGSVLEMMFVAVLETSFLGSKGKRPTLRINPASGVDLPDLDLGIKTPSENYCTSEPFFSAYERLHGTEYDVIALLTDYQTAKSKPPLKLQILNARYLSRTQIADQTLCRIAGKHRARLLQEGVAKATKVFRFLAYINQSDWRARHLLKLIENVYDDEATITHLQSIEANFLAVNAKRNKANKELILDHYCPVKNLR